MADTLSQSGRFCHGTQLDIGRNIVPELVSVSKAGANRIPTVIRSVCVYRPDRLSERSRPSRYARPRSEGLAQGRTHLFALAVLTPSASQEIQHRSRGREHGKSDQTWRPHSGQSTGRRTLLCRQLPVSAQDELDVKFPVRGSPPVNAANGDTQHLGQVVHGS